MKGNDRADEWLSSIPVEERQREAAMFRAGEISEGWSDDEIDLLTLSMRDRAKVARALERADQKSLDALLLKALLETAKRTWLPQAREGWRAATVMSKAAQKIREACDLIREAYPTQGEAEAEEHATALIAKYFRGGLDKNLPTLREALFIQRLVALMSYPKSLRQGLLCEALGIDQTTYRQLKSRATRKCRAVVRDYMATILDCWQSGTHPKTRAALPHRKPTQEEFWSLAREMSELGLIPRELSVTVGFLAADA